MFPAIFYLSVVIFFTFFVHFYFSIIANLFFFLLLVFLLILKNKRVPIFFIIVYVCSFLFHDYSLEEHFSSHATIVESKCFAGMIVCKKKLKKKYIYHIKIHSCMHKNKKRYVDSLLTVISKQDISLGSFVSVPSVIFLQKFLSIKHMKEKPINLLSHASGMSNYLKIKLPYDYALIYKPYNWLFSIREKFHCFLDNFFDDDNKIFFDTIVIGKTIEHKKYKNLFLLWGISHYLARSGLHIQIAINCIMSTLLFLGFSYVTSSFLQLLILLFFYFFTFPSLSFLRALLMFLFIVMCRFLRIPTTSLHTLSATSLLIFYLYPFAFLQLGTQLTFFITMILALIQYMRPKRKIKQ
jgi:hypothetical protein